MAQELSEMQRETNRHAAAEIVAASDLYAKGKISLLPFLKHVGIIQGSASIPKDTPWPSVPIVYHLP